MADRLICGERMCVALDEPRAKSVRGVTVTLDGVYAVCRLAEPHREHLAYPFVDKKSVVRWRSET